MYIVFFAVVATLPLPVPVPIPVPVVITGPILIFPVVIIIQRIIIIPLPPPLPIPQLVEAKYNVKEDDGVIHVCYTVNFPANGSPINLFTRTLDGTATAGRDYIPIASGVVITRADITLCHSIGIRDDQVQNGKRFFRMIIWDVNNFNFIIIEVCIWDDESSKWCSVNNRS